MLFAKRNQAYVDDEEQAKKVVFDRTIKWVNRLYPDDNKEVGLRPGKISSQLQYGYDSLFESFRSAIEQVLSASYNDELTTQKNYEIVRKYNQLSSYLKNIMGMNKLSPEDEESINKDFNDLRPKLVELKKIAIDNGFADVEDIIVMVDKLNQAKPNFEKVSAKSEGMIKSIKTKEEAYNTLYKIENMIANITKSITGSPHNAAIYKASLDEFKKQYEIYSKSDTLTNSDYISILDNYKRLYEMNKNISHRDLELVNLEKLKDSIIEKVSKNDEHYDEHYMVGYIKYLKDTITNKYLNKIKDEDFKDAFNDQYDELSDKFLKILMGYKNEWKDNIFQEHTKNKNIHVISGDMTEEEINEKSTDLTVFDENIRDITEILINQLKTWFSNNYNMMRDAIKTQYVMENPGLPEEKEREYEMKDAPEYKPLPKPVIKKEVIQSPKVLKPSTTIYTTKKDFLNAFNHAVSNNIESQKANKPSIYTNFKSVSHQTLSSFTTYWRKYETLPEAQKHTYFEIKDEPKPKPKPHKKGRK
jgi:hypothetical protein